MTQNELIELKLGSAVDEGGLAALCVSMGYREASDWCLALVLDSLLRYFLKRYRK